MKPVQAIATIEAGYAGTGSDLALAAASRGGEPDDVFGVQRILPGALPAGRSFAAKIEDGGEQPLPGLLAEILARFDLVSSRANARVHPDLSVANLLWRPLCASD